MTVWSTPYLGNLLGSTSTISPNPFVAPSSLELRKKIITAGTIVGNEVKRLKLKLSDKSVVVPISAASRGAASHLGKQTSPVLLRVANTVDDVGIEMGGGRRRMAQTQNKRIFGKAKNRSKRTKELVHRNMLALKLVMPGVSTQQSYGHQVNGASPSQVLGMRRNIKGATHLGGTGACLTTSIA